MSRNSRKQQKSNRLAIRLVTVMVLILITVVGVNIVRLRREMNINEKRYAQDIERQREEQKRKNEIDEFEQYTGTLNYVEEVAREKLGMVLGNEIVFKPNKNHD